LFGYAKLTGYFIVLNLNDTYNNTSSIFASYFDSDSKYVK